MKPSGKLERGGEPGQFYLALLYNSLLKPMGFQFHRMLAYIYHNLSEIKMTTRTCVAEELSWAKSRKLQI